MCCAVCDLGWHLDCPFWAAMRRASSTVPAVYNNPEWVSDSRIIPYTLITAGSYGKRNVSFLKWKFVVRFIE